MNRGGDFHAVNADACFEIKVNIGISWSEQVANI